MSNIKWFSIVKDNSFHYKFRKKIKSASLDVEIMYKFKRTSFNKIIKILQMLKECFIVYFILFNESNSFVSDKGNDDLVINIHV